MSQEDPPCLRFPELNQTMRAFFKDLLALLRSRLGEKPKWPVWDSYEPRQYQRVSPGQINVRLEPVKREFPMLALYELWDTQVATLASYKEVVRQLRVLEKERKILALLSHPDSHFLLPLTKEYRNRPANLSITHKLGLLVHDRFDFVRGDDERDVHGALARAFRRSFSMSL